MNGYTSERKLIVFAQWFTFPIFMSVTFLALYSVQFTDISPLAIQMGALTLTILMVAYLERLLPLHGKSHKRDKQDGRTNFISFVVLMSLIDPFIKITAPLLLSTLIVVFGIPEGFNLMPDHWSFGSQFLTALLIAEFGEYWMHRFGHVSSLWRFHAAHHSSSRMNWLTGFRVHPFNMIYHYLSGVFVLMLIGTSEIVILTYITLQSVSNVFQHTNVKFNYGPLNYIFSTNELHRWHHSAIQREANANYGVVLIIWDLLFGSYYNKTEHRPANYGLFTTKNYPVNNYWKQLIAPLFWKKWKLSTTEVTDNVS